MPPPETTHILEASLYAQDLNAAENFYSEVIGLDLIVRVPGRHVFFRLGPGVLLIFNPDATELPPTNPKLPVPPHGAHGPGHLCLSADRGLLDDWRNHLQARNVEIEADFLWPNGARSIYFRDPSGNSLEIAEPGLWNDAGK